MTDKKKNEIEKTEGKKTTKKTSSHPSTAMEGALRHVAKVGLDYQGMAIQLSPLIKALESAPPIQDSMFEVVQKIAEERKDLFDSISFHSSEVIKTQTALETVAKSVNASVMDIKKIAEMTNSTYTTLKNLQSMGALGVISAYNYLKQLSALEEDELEELEDSTDSEIEIIEPYKGVPLEVPVNHSISQDEIQALQKHYDDEVGFLKDKITELEALVNQIKGVERISISGEINLQTKPAGRKTEPWNPLAYEILMDGKPEAESRAFQAWCEAKGIKNPEKSERDAFKKAMKRQSRRRTP